MKSVNLFLTKLILKIFLILISLKSFSQEIHKTKYDPDAISISESGLLKGQDAISAYWKEFQKFEGEFIKYETVYKTQVLNVLEYEIGLSETANDGQFAHIVIWSKEKDTPKMAEVIFRVETSLDVPPKLTEARNKWVKLCNEHNAKDLVTELYTEDAIYYNRGRVLTGHNQLSMEYSYMNDPSYSLQLNPKHIEMVRDDLIFEIGQCSGSYPLPYILIWKKQQDGDWKIYFDSNY